MAEDWLDNRVVYIKALKSPTDLQRLLVLIADKPEKTEDDEKKLKALVRAEKASVRAMAARASAGRIVNAAKESARKARTHELCESAGLMSLAGLLDKRTGTPMLDRGELLGALLELSLVPESDERRSVWKAVGDRVLAGKTSDTPATHR
jgi:hypothetical protein